MTIEEMRDYGLALKKDPARHTSMDFWLIAAEVCDRLEDLAVAMVRSRTPVQSSMEPAKKGIKK